METIYHIILFFLLLDIVTGFQVIETFAGTGVQGYNGDEIEAATAQINTPFALTINNHGDVLIADANNNRIRKVDTSGIISTIAGTDTAGFSGDDANAIDGQLHTPRGLYATKNNYIFISDSGNHRIRRIGPAGLIITYAGTGVAGYSGDDGDAKDAKINQPIGICASVSSNHLITVYFTDTWNNRIRMINEDGIISTLAGTGND